MPATPQPGLGGELALGLFSVTLLSCFPSDFYCAVRLWNFSAFGVVCSAETCKRAHQLRSPFSPFVRAAGEVVRSRCKAKRTWLLMFVFLLGEKLTPPLHERPLSSLQRLVGWGPRLIVACSAPKCRPTDCNKRRLCKSPPKKHASSYFAPFLSHLPLGCVERVSAASHSVLRSQRRT